MNTNYLSNNNNMTTIQINYENRKERKFPNNGSENNNNENMRNRFNQNNTNTEVFKTSNLYDKTVKNQKLKRPKFESNF